MARLSDDSKTMFKLLADEQWHPYEEIRDAIAATVPPGRALRKYEERLRLKRGWQNTEKVESDLSEDEQIHFGRRSCAQIAISNWKGKGVIQRVMDDGRKEIKLKPGFVAYGVNDPSPVASDGPKTPSEAQGDGEVPPEAAGASGDELTGAEWASEQGEDLSVAADLAAGAAQAGAEPVERVDVDDLPPPQVARAGQQHDPYAWPPLSQSVTLPECPECGLHIVNDERHREWHEAQKRRLERTEMALFDEVTLRTLLGDVVGQVLNDFQAGMQGWLIGQFVQLEAQIRASAEPGRPWTLRTSRHDQ